MSNGNVCDNRKCRVVVNSCQTSDWIRVERHWCSAPLEFCSLGCLGQWVEAELHKPITTVRAGEKKPWWERASWW